MDPRPPLRGLAARLFLAMAFVAVTMKVVVPAGYMLEAPRDRAGLTLVLCTADGLVTLSPDGEVDHDGSQETPERADHNPCLFAGHGVYSPPVLFDAGLAEAWPVLITRNDAARPHLAPGRGLAAPPPPARGPPTLTT